jgi:hypothetical protein
MHVGKEFPADCPDLVDIDDNGNEIPSLPIWPSKDHVIQHAPYYRYDNPKTVTDDDILLCIGDDIFFRQAGRVYPQYPLQASKRGPHLPSQSVLELQVMSTNVEYCLDPVQALDDHRNNPRKNADRLEVVLRVAAVEPDYRFTGQCNHLITKLVDRVHPENSPMEVFASEQEYNAYAEACDLAAGTGWAVHMANDCERRFHQNMQACFAECDPDHNMRNL